MAYQLRQLRSDLYFFAGIGMFMIDHTWSGVALWFLSALVSFWDRGEDNG